MKNSTDLVMTPPLLAHLGHVLQLLLHQPGQEAEAGHRHEAALPAPQVAVVGLGGGVPVVGVVVRLAGHRGARLGEGHCSQASHWQTLGDCSQVRDWPTLGDCHCDWPTLGDCSQASDWPTLGDCHSLAYNRGLSL